MREGDRKRVRVDEVDFIYLFIYLLLLLLFLIKRGVSATYFRRIVGSLRYLCSTRPHLTFSVDLFNRYMECRRVPHMLAAKKILRYVKDTQNYGILIPKHNPVMEARLFSYSDSDWGGDKDDRKSTAGGVFMLFKHKFHGVQRRNPCWLDPLVKLST